MADSEKVPEQQQIKQKHPAQVSNHAEGVNGDATAESAAEDSPPQPPKQIIGKCNVPIYLYPVCGFSV